MKRKYSSEEQPGGAPATEDADGKPGAGAAASKSLNTDTLSRAAERLCDWCMDKDTSLLRSKVECQSFVIADMTAPDCPIRYASDGFLHLTGYSREEITDRNCRFLQGYAPRKRALAIVPL